MVFVSMPRCASDIGTGSTAAAVPILSVLSAEILVEAFACCCDCDLGVACAAALPSLPTPLKGAAMRVGSCLVSASDFGSVCCASLASASERDELALSDDAVDESDSGAFRIK